MMYKERKIVRLENKRTPLEETFPLPLLLSALYPHPNASRSGMSVSQCLSLLDSDVV
jgi:hypothetical protein